MKKFILLWLIIVSSFTVSFGTNVTYLFQQENFDEIVEILQKQKESSLSPKELYYLGYSLFMLGNYKKGVLLVNRSFQLLPNKENGEFLIKVFYGSAQYRKVINLYKTLKKERKEISDRIKLLVAKAALMEGNKELANKLFYSIDNRTEKELIPSEKLFYFSILEKYDSNILFLPDSYNPVNYYRSGFITDLSLNLKRTSTSGYTGIGGFISFQNNRNNTPLDFAMIQFYEGKKINDFIGQANFYLVYTQKQVYMSGLKFGTEKMLKNMNVLWKIGYERNFYTVNRNSFLTELTALKGAFVAGTEYRLFKDSIHRLSVKSKYTKRFRPLDKMLSEISLWGKGKLYSEGSRALIPGISIKAEKYLQHKITIFTQITFSKSFATGDMETDYTRYTLGLGLIKIF